MLVAPLFHCVTPLTDGLLNRHSFQIGLFLFFHGSTQTDNCRTRKKNNDKKRMSVCLQTNDSILAPALAFWLTKNRGHQSSKKCHTARI